MGTAVRPAKTSPGPWDALADVDVFVDAVLAELEAMAKDGTRPMRSGPKPPLTGAELRKAGMAIWCVNFCGIPFGTLYGLFARWTRLGLWRRRLGRLHRDWRRACGDAPEPSAVVIDSRSCRSAPNCFDRGIDGGKKIKGVKIHVAVDKCGFPLGSMFLRQIGSCAGGTLASLARGRDGRFVPAGICWMVERSFAWLSCYRRLNTIFERTKEHLVAFVEIAFISILSRRLNRLVANEVRA
jgi:hypothetical protein